MPDHTYFMQQAIEIGRQNPRAPFGCVIADSDSEQVVATGINQSKCNPILHGEMDAISNCAKLTSPNWERLRLYTTAEPCCMCQAAIIWARIPQVFFGTSIATLVEFGWRQFRLTAQDVADSANFSQCQITGGVLVDSCDQLFKNASTN